MSKATRKGPLKSATLYPVNTIMQGEDKNMWKVIRTSNKTKRWSKIKDTEQITKKASKKATKKLSKASKKTIIKTNRSKSVEARLRKYNKLREKRYKELINMKNTNTYVQKSKIKPKTFITDDNGGRPFKVVINDKKLVIYACSNYNTGDNIKIYKKVCLETSKYVGYWSGFDSSEYKSHGNSILVKVNNHEYIFIGTEVFSFTTTDIIEDFITPLGNSDVPYPIAYGTDNVYFLNNKKYRNKKYLLTNISVADAENIQTEYFNYGKDKNNHRIKNIKIIHKRLE
ncbi:hypothetical protein Hokovirus_2_245 [Hokovirus HKV1]|uniref:Uncharacterized protein n=1 Tax=Hokovirus HKV1 TaxID=1977638 RepID=A0A1V0SGH0_9VIRU|nr:hypothetical protein Hokovirus_2_245 [Hokovirus HKV1]